METLATLFFGGLIACLVMIAAIDMSPKSYKNIVDTAIKECEKSLPRDQNCKIIAVPKEQK